MKKSLAAAFALGVGLLAGGAAVAPAVATPQDKITICHIPPGNPDNPRTITISLNAWKTGHPGGHQEGGHGGDYEGVCKEPSTTPTSTAPTTPPTTAPTTPPTHAPKKVKVCHKPGTPAQKTLRIPVTALPAHLKHGDTLGKCPKPTPSPTVTTSPTTVPPTTPPTTVPTTRPTVKPSVVPSTSTPVAPAPTEQETLTPVHGEDNLPLTGSSFPWSMLLTGLGIMGVGATLLVWAVRRNTTE